MKRPLSQLFSRSAILHLRYLPEILLKIKNWHVFLVNYLGFANLQNELYELRKGIKIKTEDTFDVSTIAVVFIKKDYGTVPNNSVIVDIGANIGVFSLYAETIAKNSVIYAYEPLKNSFDLLLKNIKINKLEQKIKAFNLGIAGKRQKRRLYIYGGSPFHSLYGSNDYRFVEINCITLSDIIDDNHLDHIDLLKIDCEGAEFEIFYNTSCEYLQKIKEIKMEYHNQDNKKNNINELTKWLNLFGFSTIFKNVTGEGFGNVWFSR